MLGAIGVMACAVDGGSSEDPLAVSSGLASNEQAANLCFTKGMATFDAGGLDETGVLVTASAPGEGPATRAVLGTPSRTSPVPLVLADANDYQRGELSFTYNGRVANPVQTGSGLTRYQTALKLRALNGCNVIYVTWIFDSQRLLVQRKFNPLHSSSSTCGNNGYVTVADIALVQAEPALGSQHTLTADLDGDTLSVSIDGVSVDLDPTTTATSKVVPDATAFDGPPGLRTDNIDIDFTYRATNEISNSSYFVATSATNGTGAPGNSNSCPFGE
jgi:hypothetical protein